MNGCSKNAMVLLSTDVYICSVQLCFKYILVDMRAIAARRDSNVEFTSWMFFQVFYHVVPVEARLARNVKMSF